ncbi:hypothetical protein, partial [Staphylococcus aureus]
TPTSNSVTRGDNRSRSGQGGASDSSSPQFSEALDAEDKKSAARPSPRPVRPQPQRRPTIADTPPAAQEAVAGPAPAPEKRQVAKTERDGDRDAKADDKTKAAPPTKDDAAPAKDAAATDAPPPQPTPAPA